MGHGVSTRLGLVLLLVSGCGRYGFDPVSGDEIAGDTDAGVAERGNQDAVAEACLACAAEHKSCDVASSACVVAVDCKGEPDFTRCDSESGTEGICVEGACVVPGCGDRSCDTPGPRFALPDTGQVTCFDDTRAIACPGVPGSPSCASTPFCGQDAQIVGTGAERFVVDSTVVGEGTVRDQVTNLMWQQCRGGLSGADCSAGALLTGEWQTAMDHCESSTWGGFDDWRTPDIYEVQTIVDYGAQLPAIKSNVFFDATEIQWTASTFSNFAGNALTMIIEHGFANNWVKTNSAAVRCVRGFGALLEPTRVERNPGPEPTVIDHYTGLHWQGCQVGASGDDCSQGAPADVTWKEALSACEGLSWAGFDDWRLPNASELRMTSSSRIDGFAMDTELFVNMPAEEMWSSTTALYDLTTAWVVSSSGGYIDTTVKTIPLRALCVR